MTDYDDYEDDDQQDGTALVRDLRKALKDLSKKNKDMEQKLTETLTKTRSMTLAEVLKGAGVSEKVARLVPSDVEPTAEAVGEWLKEFGDVFGSTTRTDTTSTDGQESEEDSEAAQKITQMQNVASTGEIQVKGKRITPADLQTMPIEEFLKVLADAKAAGPGG